MPFPKFNVLSWSYAIAVLSFVLTLVTFLVGFVRYMYLDAVLDEYQIALLRQQADMGVSSPPVKGREAPKVAYEPRGTTAPGSDVGRYLSHNPYAVGSIGVDGDEDAAVDEETANADFDEIESERTNSNFNGLDPRFSSGRPYPEEYRPMIHHSRG
ncbi:unnamed protein product [Echinostoma caproni]|uniref:Col_cuticle_N domain-containing protein n=1 Tax=Echinostoma caproni TaxID=27848 RepID=A0A183AX21_9TREM|nr:unnamed protein product [Echinostoma caproni]